MTYSNNDSRLRNGFKPRRESMRDSYAQRMGEKGRGAVSTLEKGQKPYSEALASNSGLKRKPLKKQSKARAREMRVYHEERRAWLALPEHSACAICLCLGQSPRPATEIHHKNGRMGRLLRYQPWWIASCRSCRSVPHDRPVWAREMGILGDKNQWNIFPREATVS